MLEFDDLQYIMAARVPALTGRYEFLSFRQPARGRAWLKGILDKVASAQQARESVEREQRWVSVAFTWQGLRALGVDEQSLATFPKEFRDGMSARAEVLGDEQGVGDARHRRDEVTPTPRRSTADQRDGIGERGAHGDLGDAVAGGRPRDRAHQRAR